MPSPTVIGTNSTASSNATDTSITFSHTVPTTGSNRMLIVLYVADSVGASSATYNSVSMTLVTNDNADTRYYTRIFYLANPATGTNDVVVNWASTSGPKQVTAITIQDAVQSSPLDPGTSPNNGTTAVTSRTTTVTTGADNVLGFHVTRVGLNATSLTQNADQTEQSSFQDANNRWMNTGTKVWTTSGSNTIGISWTTSTDVEQGAIGIKYEPPPVTPISNLLTLKAG